LVGGRRSGGAQRTSKAGRPFVTATLKAKNGDDAQWWKVLAFSESIQADLLRLQDGDTISVQGEFKAELYDKDGEKRLSLSIVADNALALRRPARKRERTQKECCAGSWQSPADGPNDQIPF
jgi:single-stranded DNA-binding protein